MSKLIWASNMKKLERGNRVVIANGETGNWIKISKECFDILNDAVEHNIEEKELIEEFKTEEDKKYIERLIEQLRNLEVWKTTEEEKYELEQVYLLITHRCNLNCIHCSMNALQCVSEDYLDTQKLIEVIDTVIGLKPKQIILSGGEPLYRKDFCDILSYLSDNYKGEITLMTNATLITEQNVGFIVDKVSSIDISIDGIDEMTCQNIRGKGVFEKVLKSVGIIQAQGFEKISLSMVFGNSNYHMLPQFYKMNEKLGTKPVPRAFSPIGRGKLSREYFDKCSEEQLKEFSQEKMQETLKVCNCMACRKEICIDYYGDIYPCSLLTKEKYKLGSVFNKEDVKAIVNQKLLVSLPGFQEFEKLYPDKMEYCKKCDLNIFCWSCLHFVDTYIDSENFEERCKSKKEALEKLVWDME